MGAWMIDGFQLVGSASAKYGYQFTVRGTSAGFKALAVPIRYPEEGSFSIFTWTIGRN